MRVDPENAMKIMEHILNLTQEGFYITFGPGPYNKTIDLHLQKEDLKCKLLIDFEHGICYQDPCEVLDRTINALAHEINYKLSVMKAKGE